MSIGTEGKNENGVIAAKGFDMEKTHGRYDDIIDLPHHISPTRPHMSMSDRAAQFSPFAALTGYDGVIRESGRLTKERAELSEEELEILGRKQQYLMSIIEERPEITVTYFVPDSLKEGGEYMTCSGRLKRIDEYERKLIFTDGTKVNIDDVVEIEGGTDYDLTLNGL